MNLNPAPATGGGGITIVDSSALMPEEGPSGTMADIEKPKNSTISTYVVREGDSLSSIAKLFTVTPGTILAANGLSSKDKLQVGQKLVILPVTGINYTIKKGDTLESIAKRFGGDATEIATYNGIESDARSPSERLSSSPTAKYRRPRTVFRFGYHQDDNEDGQVTSKPAHNVGPQGDASEISYYIAPLAHYIETQGIHGYNAVDLAAPTGTPIMAAAAGDVVVARQGGWNGGYGSYVVISHDNGSQTLYGHMSKVATYDGASVQQGESSATSDDRPCDRSSRALRNS